MRKALKASGYVALVLALLLSFGYIANTMIVGFLFDKVYDKVVSEMASAEKQEETKRTENSGDEPDESTVEKTEKEQQLENAVNGETEEEKTSKKPEEVRIKKISELTAEEIEGIKAIVSSTDKATVIGIVKSSLTADDKREIKAMLESGRVDYGRCQQIASARLSVEQKRRIYAYYEKYAKIYFANK